MPRGKRKTQTEEVIVQTSPAAPEITAETPAPKKRGGRPKKNSTENVSPAPAVETIAENTETPAPKKRGGRPKKNITETVTPAPAVETAAENTETPAPKKRGGRPKKNSTENVSPSPAIETVAENTETPAPKKHGGRPKKNITENISPAPAAVEETTEATPKRRGRKSKTDDIPVIAETAEDKPKRGRRGKKNVAEVPVETETATKKRGGRRSKISDDQPVVTDVREVPSAPVEPELPPFEKLFNSAADKIGKSSPTAYFAAEITLTGNITGKFYVKCSADGMEVMPYNYNDADLIVEVDSDTLENIIAGNIAPREAVISGKLEMIGRASIMAAFVGLIS